MDWHLRVEKSGIYKIQSIIHPERIYIGSSCNINKRFKEHTRTLKLNKHDSPKLQCHFNKYGETDLQFSILLECDKEELIKHEQFFIDSLYPWFNVCPTAGNCLGRKHTPETKAKLKIKRANRIISEETKLKISNSLKGRPSPTKGTKQSQETINKRIEKTRGQKRTAETKLKISESHKGINHYSWGKPPYKRVCNYTDEIRMKLSLIHSNITDKTRELMSISAKNRIRKPCSEETKRKIQLKNKGRHLSILTEFKKGHIGLNPNIKKQNNGG